MGEAAGEGSVRDMSQRRRESRPGSLHLQDVLATIFEVLETLVELRSEGLVS